MPTSQGAVPMLPGEAVCALVCVCVGVCRLACLGPGTAANTCLWHYIHVGEGRVASLPFEIPLSYLVF